MGEGGRVLVRRQCLVGEKVKNYFRLLRQCEGAGNEGHTLRRPRRLPERYDM